MSRVIKFRAYVKFLGEMQAVTEIKLNGNVFVDDYFYALARGDINLMQYTGLKDKNGVEIYEGDIIKTDDGIYQLSIADMSLLELSAHGKHYNYNEDYYEGAHAAMWPWSIFEVIGNIHQNPELLK